ncbi:hypothetical protein CE91St14_12890 [Porphyromonas somerae]|nr:hypothetical protein CE91St14_12890 [Porphyromonas somerae]
MLPHIINVSKICSKDTEIIVIRECHSQHLQGLRIRKDYCANDDIQSVEDNGVSTSAEVPLK